MYYSTNSHTSFSPNRRANNDFDILSPLRRWIDEIEINNSKIARLFCQLIPNSCPFETDINLFGRTLFHIPALCKLNPLYNELMSLRFRSLSYLADACGQDITQYL